MATTESAVLDVTNRNSVLRPVAPRADAPFDRDVRKPTVRRARAVNAIAPSQIDGDGTTREAGTRRT